MFRKKDNQPKVKELSPREILTAKIAAEIEALVPGESLIYQFPEAYFADLRFHIVELNPEFPEKGKKYFMCVDSIQDGKPAGKKRRLQGTNNAGDAAKWIAEGDNNNDWGPIRRIQ